MQQSFHYITISFLNSSFKKVNAKRDNLCYIISTKIYHYFIIEINKLSDGLNYLFYSFITLLYFYNSIIYKIYDVEYNIRFHLI